MPNHRYWPLVALLGAPALLALVWRLTPLGDQVDLETVRGWLGALQGSGWELAAVIAGFIAGGLVLFPVMVMITATGLAFGFWPGFAYALAGSLASAAVAFTVGRLLGRPALRRLPDGAVERVSRELGRHGILAVAMLDALPLAPFTVTNLAMGASGVRLRDFLIGTVLGMAPGMALLTALGGQLQRALRSPTPGQLAMVAGLLIVWLAVAFALQHVVGRREEPRSGPAAMR